MLFLLCAKINNYKKKSKSQRRQRLAQAQLGAGRAIAHLQVRCNRAHCPDGRRWPEWPAQCG